MKIENATKILNLKPKLGESQSHSAKEANQEVPESKSLISIIGQCLPFAPLVFEQFTGQKVPQMSGTMADIQTAIQQVQTNQQQLLTNQEEIFARIVNLESNASQQLTSLDKRIENLQSIRLTHEKERKQIEYNQPKLETNYD
jgi:hypothetical protein